MKIDDRRILDLSVELAIGIGAIMFSYWLMLNSTTFSQRFQNYGLTVEGVTNVIFWVGSATIFAAILTFVVRKYSRPFGLNLRSAKWLHRGI